MNHLLCSRRRAMAEVCDERSDLVRVVVSSVARFG